MPWTMQKCPFCDKQYANKKALRDHLIKYTAAWRLPADGIHDVLEIKKLYDQDNDREEIVSYKCPSCPEVISDEFKFMNHVNRWHDLILPGLSSDLPRYKVWKPSGVFPFFKLPLELREMIYKAALTFHEIYVYDVTKTNVRPTSQWISLQHNPPRNLLSLLAVNRQVYHEARRIFYRYNTFVFKERESIPGFLVGIGRENALFLKSIKWANCNHFGDCGKCEPENNLKAIEPYIQEAANIWNDEDQFMGMLLATMSFISVFNNGNDRLLRLDDDNASTGDDYQRYKLSLSCFENDEKWRSVEAAYVLRSRPVDGHPVRYRAYQGFLKIRRTLFGI